MIIGLCVTYNAVRLKDSCNSFRVASHIRNSHCHINRVRVNVGLSVEVGGVVTKSGL